MLGAMQRVKVRNKAVSYITLLYSGRGYYHGHIRISWKYARSVDIIRISWKFARFVDIIRISCIYLYFVNIINIL